MNDVVIRAEGLGKKYLIGHQAPPERYTALRDVIARGARGLARSAVDLARGRPLIPGDKVEEFWALRDVSFEVRRGEVVGIIGRNGAGKSTLLKVLSRITEPSAGRVTVRGRVASLLEVGTGFHPELTGRENIYLNGAILGMTRAEIRARFDAIVAFAEVERFLDTPVKRYSSGMYVRLAFAVAAHLEPEILIVDEVLAVGDAEFQRKCLGKMEEVAGGGRTVLFVSHNMGAITALCSRGILLRGGTICHNGNASDAISRYIEGGDRISALSGRRIDVRVALERCELVESPAFSVEFNVILRGPLEAPHIGLGINDGQGGRITTILSETDRALPSLRDGESFSFKIKTESIRFAPGTLLIKVELVDMNRYREVHDDALGLIVPEYSPFSHPPHVRPRGPVWIKAKIAMNKCVTRNIENATY